MSEYIDAALARCGLPIVVKSSDEYEGRIYVGLMGAARAAAPRGKAIGGHYFGSGATQAYLEAVRLVAELER